MSVRLLRLLTSAAPGAADADLLGRFVASRDEAAFAELVRRHGPAVHRVCRRLAGPSSADDAFQATFLVLACRAAAVRKAASVGSWLIGVAGRVARQTRRQETRRAAGVSRLVGEAHQPADAGRSPEVAELAAVLDDELTRLPDALRAAVVLCLVEGRTQEQAAGAIGGSVRTVRRRLDEAKALLRSRLERRGVVPAVAAGLVTSPPTASAVPPELVRRTVEGVFEFLAAGPAVRAAPAVLAKGVLASMTTLNAKLLVPAAAVLAVGFGVVWVNGQQPALQPAEPLRPAVTGGVPPAAAEPPPAVSVAVPVPDGGSVLLGGMKTHAATHRTPNFVVTAPTPVVARAVAAEAEYQRGQFAKTWLGKALPDWDKPATVTVTEVYAGSGGATTFTFSDAKAGPRVTSASMELRGPFPAVLGELLPHEVAHTVLATHFGKPLPRWADEGIALLNEPADSQARHDELARRLLGDGRAIRLKNLLRLTEYPQDLTVLYAQGHSVARFLLARGPKEPSPAARTALLEFVRAGMGGNTAASWDKAVKDVYGFESADKLEEAWVDWLREPGSILKPTGAAVPPAERRGYKSDLIPPTEVPGAVLQPPVVRP
jgi:RNA polymerase sigma factor (sigma-70 family)